MLCGLLLLASVYASSSPSTVVSSVASDPPSSSSVGVDGSSTTQGTSLPQSSTMQGSTGTKATQPSAATSTTGNPATQPATATHTTESPDPSTEPQSTVTGPTPASTLTPSANPDTTPAGTTGAPTTTTTTTTTTTPIPITVKKAQVTMACSGGRCKYLLQVPRLSKAFMQQQEGILATDQALLENEQNEYQNLTNTNDVKDIEEKFNELNNSVQDAIKEYNRIQDALKNIPTQSLATNTSATKIQSYITTLRTQTNTCLYDECLKPATTTVTSTTPTTTTTTPNPCNGKDPCNGQADCKSVGGKAACEPCRGNLANGLMCVTSTCTAVGTSQSQNVTSGSWLVSPGFNITDKGSPQPYGSNLACEWTLKVNDGATYLALPTDDKNPFSTMDTTGKLVMKCGSFMYTITSVSSITKVNGALKTCTVPTLTFTFTSGTVTGNAFFGVQLLTQP
ncbi:unnamed protein product, partial [Mesorhabditis belari]|uniref:CUB domain-containing protein n=1 Tax=Mesorhabditis belari TaxID=2138241 RepID=A0AAF3EN93_9BILA